jgi:hypothetical protein
MGIDEIRRTGSRVGYAWSGHLSAVGREAYAVCVIIDGSRRLHPGGEQARRGAHAARTARLLALPGELPVSPRLTFAEAGMESFFDRFAALPSSEVSPGAFATIGAEVGMDVRGPPLRG